MTPVRVVLSLNPGKDRQAPFGVRLPDPPVNQLTLQLGKEAFCHGAVIGVADCSHAGPDTHFFAAFSKRHRRAGCPVLNGESPTQACA